MVPAIESLVAALSTPARVFSATSLKVSSSRPLGGDLDG